MAHGRPTPLTIAGAIAAYNLAHAEQLTPAERREIAARRAAALAPVDRAALARNQALLDAAAIKVNMSAVAVNGPNARLLERQ